MPRRGISCALMSACDGGTVAELEMFGRGVWVKKILFLTGTRADFGKLKPLMRAIANDADFECRLFVTGMHTLARYGYTVDEIRKSDFNKLHLYMNQIAGEPMDLVLANTIVGLSRYVHEEPPDMIVVHGDRVEALAGAIVGSLRNILTAHVEGGELSGTIDGLIRHSVSKMSHLHFVSNEEAAARLRQLGEAPESVFNIGSPDIDVMLSRDLPSLPSVKERYGIRFEQFAVAAFHPVTTERGGMLEQARIFVSALIDSKQNYVVIYPNNDAGADQIFDALEAVKGNNRFCLFPSLRFEYFLALLKNAQFIIGNSSAGIREAPVYGVPSIDIGNRQKGRFLHTSIINVPPRRDRILEAIIWALKQRIQPCYHFGSGKSAEAFMKVIRNPEVWIGSPQKEFRDVPLDKLGQGVGVLPLFTPIASLETVL